MTISESGQGVAVALEVSGEHSGDGLMVELSDFRGLSLSYKFYDSLFSIKDEAALLLFLTSADILAHFS